MLITAPTGEVASFAVITARSVLSGDIAGIAADLPESDRGFVCARYLSEPVRRQLDTRGVSYSDATGNTALSADRPAIWVRNRGADADPWRGPGRPSGHLTGDPAARVVRALADFVGPLTVPELIRLSGASTGATYRVVEALADRDLLDRLPRGPITDVRWPEMLRAWSADASFVDCPTIGYFAPEGIRSVIELLAARPDLTYAVTGSLASAPFAEYAPARIVQLYADDTEAVADALDLRPVDDGANALVATPRSASVFDRTVDHRGVRLVAPSQAFADLLAAPGQGPAEAEHLLRWLTAHESQWRRMRTTPD